jgi:hypothetical protein
MNRSEIDLFQNGYGVYYEATSPEEAAYTSFCPESPARDSGRAGVLSVVIAEVGEAQ